MTRKNKNAFKIIQRITLLNITKTIISIRNKKKTSPLFFKKHKKIMGVGVIKPRDIAKHSFFKEAFSFLWLSK